MYVIIIWKTQLSTCIKRCIQNFFHLLVKSINIFPLTLREAILNKLITRPPLRHLLSSHRYPCVVYQENQVWKFGNNEIIEFLLSKGVNVNEQTPSFQDTALIAAATSGQLETVKMLVEKYNADIHLTCNHGYTPLINAVQLNYNDVVEYLLNKGAYNIRAQQRTRTDHLKQG